MLGHYRHFKGGHYEVIAEAIDANTEAPLVIYRPEGSAQLWVRTRENFTERVVRDGYDGPRFARLEKAT